MVIRDVKPNANDKTLSVSNNLLAGLGGDYDGDVLNIIALFSKEQASAFKNIDPRNQIISNNNGTFSRTYAFDKDNLKAVWDLNN